MYWRIFFLKELFREEPFTKKSFYLKTFGGNLWGGVFVHEGAYDQIMSRERELYKSIFQ